MSNTGFSVHTDAAGVVPLAKAILLYEGPGGQGSYATIHEVAYPEGQPVILAGKACRWRDALTMARELSRAKPLGYVPQGLLYHDDMLMVWWLPPAVRRVMFRAEALREDELAAEVPHPGLVFMAGAKGQWRVWAVQGGAQPTPDTPLYLAPYLNVNEQGSICSGNVQLPNTLHPDQLGAWNDAFFGTRFTHANGKARLIDFDGSILAFWRAMVDGAFADGFPTHRLIPNGLRLSDVIEQAAHA